MIKLKTTRLSIGRLVLLLAFSVICSASQANMDNNVDSLKNTLATTKSDASRLQSYYAFIRLHSSKSLTTALAYSDTALELATAMNDQKWLADVRKARGDIFRRRSMIHESYKENVEAMRLYESLQDSVGISAVLGNMGILRLDQNDFSGALEYFHESLQIAEKIGDSMLAGHANNNIAITYSDQDYHAEALNYYSKASEYYELSGSLLNMVNVTMNIATIRETKKEYESALQAYLESLSIYEQLGNAANAALAMGNIGNLYALMRQFSKADSFINASVEQNLFLANRRQLTFNYVSLGELYHLQERYDHSNRNFLKALELAEAIGSLEFLKTAHEGLANNYEQLGNFKRANDHNKKFKIYNDSIFNASKNQIFQELNLKYEMAQKQKEIEALENEKLIRESELHKNEMTLKFVVLTALIVLLFCSYILFTNRRMKKINTVLQTNKKDIEYKNRQLEELISLKDKLFSITTHDIRGPLISLKGLIDLFQKDRISRDETQRIFKELGIKINNTLNLLENFLTWIKNQMNGVSYQPEKVELKAVVSDVLEHFKSNIELKQLAVHTNIACKVYVFSDIKIIETVMRNLLSNAIKYSHNGGEINIDMEVKGVMAEISVADTGTGMNVLKLNSLFLPNAGSTPGTRGEKGIGLGLMLCIEFIEINKGRLWVSSKVNEGTTFTFTIPHLAS